MNIDMIKQEVDEKMKNTIENPLEEAETYFKSNGFTMVQNFCQNF